MKTQNKDKGKRLFCFYGYTRNLSSLRAYTSVAKREVRAQRLQSECVGYYDGVLYIFVA